VPLSPRVHHDANRGQLGECWSRRYLARRHPLSSSDVGPVAAQPRWMTLGVKAGLERLQRRLATKLVACGNAGAAGRLDHAQTTRPQARTVDGKVVWAEMRVI
jgi:hypothetical protein